MAPSDRKLQNLKDVQLFGLSVLLGKVLNKTDLEETHPHLAGQIEAERGYARALLIEDGKLETAKEKKRGEGDGPPPLR